MKEGTWPTLGIVVGAHATVVVVILAALLFGPVLVLALLAVPIAYYFAGRLAPRPWLAVALSPVWGVAYFVVAIQAECTGIGCGLGQVMGLGLGFLFTVGILGVTAIGAAHQTERA